MAYLKIVDTGATVTTYLNLYKSQQLTVTVQTALDGTSYMTRFGEPSYTYDIEVYVNEAGRDMLFDAFDKLFLMEANVKAGTFRGRLKELGNFEPQYHGWFKATVKLAEITEVTER